MTVSVTTLTECLFTKTTLVELFLEVNCLLMFVSCSNSPSNNDEPRRGESLLRGELRTNSMPTDTDWPFTRDLEHAKI